MKNKITHWTDLPDYKWTAEIRKVLAKKLAELRRERERRQK